MVVDLNALRQELITKDDLWKTSWRQLNLLETEAPNASWDAILSNHREAIPRLYELTLKDPIIFEKMQSIKRAVLSYPWSIEGEDDRIVEFATGVLDDDDFNFRNVVSFLVDAAFYGFTVGELIWDVINNQWIITRIKERPPTLFSFGEIEMPQVGELQILRPGSSIGEEVPPFKFIVYTYEPDEEDRTGTPLLREVFWASWIGRKAAALMVRAAEKGSGTVDVTYNKPPDTQFTDASGQTISIADEAQKLAEHIANGTAASHGDAYTVELLEKARQGDASVFQQIVDWSERRISLVFTGETLTSRGSDQGTGSRALGEVHRDIRNEKPTAIARDIQTVVRQQILRPLIELNFGPDVPVPKLKIKTPKQVQIESWHVDRGVVSPNEVRNTLDLEPRDGLDEITRTAMPQSSGHELPQLGEMTDPWDLWR